MQQIVYIIIIKYFFSILKPFKAVGNCFLFFIVLVFFQGYPKSFVVTVVNAYLIFIQRLVPV